MLWRSLTDPLVGMFHEGNVEVLYERTSQEVLESAANFLDAADSDDVVLLYFSGHAKRIAKNDLVLCAHNTVSHSSSALLSTGVPGDTLSKMIERSYAASVIVILDCCFSGSFKGTDREAFGELKGTGRFVIAASRPVELAADSDEGQPSPFTHAVVRGLMSVSRDDGTDKDLSLDDLFHFVEESLPSDGPRPWRGYDGSGTIVISRRSVNTEQLSAAAQNPTLSRMVHSSNSLTNVEKNTVRQWYAGSWRPARRLPGDLSIADLRTWAISFVLNVCAAVCFGLAYKAWPEISYTYSGKLHQDAHRYIIVPCILACILMAICSVVEGIFFVRRSAKIKSRRELLQAMDTRTMMVFRRAREVISYIASIAVFTTLFGFNNFSISWTIGLSVLGILALISAISSLRQGDAVYLSGCGLLIIAAFVPLQFDYGTSHIIAGAGSTADLVEIVLGASMAAAWWFKAPRGALLIITVIGLLPVVSQFIQSQSVEGDVIGPYVALVGIAVAIVAWTMGAGHWIDQSENSLSGDALYAHDSAWR